MDIVIPQQQLMTHQLEILNDKTRFKVLIWHRRARKTTTAITELAIQACLKKVYIGTYFQPMQKLKCYMDRS